MDMVGIGTSACAVSDTLAGGQPTTSGTNKHLVQKHLIQGNDTLLAYSHQEKSGNRCGHNRFKFKIPAFSKKLTTKNRRQHCIEETIRVIKQLIGYKTDKNLCIQDPRIVELLQNKKLAQLLCHFKNDEILRSRRSESIEACLGLVILSLLRGLDLHSMVFGWRDEFNKQAYFNYTKLVEYTGISYERIKKAMTILQNLDLVKVEKIVNEYLDGRYKTTTTIITVSEEMFKIFGVYQEFLLDRKHAAIKHSKIERNNGQRKSYLESFKPYSSKKKSKPQPIANVLPKGNILSANRVYAKSQKGDTDNQLVIYKNLLSAGYTPKEAFEFMSAQRKPPN
jgi:hypothetical protein